MLSNDRANYKTGFEIAEKAVMILASQTRADQRQGAEKSFFQFIAGRVVVEGDAHAVLDGGLDPQTRL